MVHERRSYMATAASGQQESLDPRAKHAIRGAWFGFFVDMFDIYLPIVVLAPAIAYFVAPDLDTTTTAVVSGTIFAATLLGRPVGSFIFGHFADSIGRKRTTIISVSGFGVITLLMALLPGYQQWGLAAVILLIVLRLVDGVFLGGEYTSANPLAMEYSPKEKRGFYSALIMSGYPLAFAAISALTTVLLLFIPAGDLSSPYVQWGWRIPFVIGSLLAFALVFYYVYLVAESELFEEEGGGGDSPGPARQPGRSLKDEHHDNTRRRQRRACRRLHRLRGDQPARGTPALPDRVWSHFGGGRHLPLLAAFERAPAEPLPGHPTGDDNHAPGRLVLGYIDRLHQRALPDRHQGLGLWYRLQPRGGPPFVVCLLPGGACGLHAL